ncbi:glutamine synthetase III [Anaerorhabdus furcosa]|uniref:Glutamine synthetase n=1 Tax=Anaerorhabdus furcosa TaxID=118967 RepID=A0A1T4PTP5_9FIRM|nr:glutamine synthetase III [Anaerorhabdus furcosa]SJZ94935.1 glutamine synthetase [Anaerorhabdus furcosa]
MKFETVFDDFGSLVFSEKVMKERLPYPVYEQWKQTMTKENSLDRNTADAIAHAMKGWALENGATHFTHWFQPLTGSTAEKHDSFIEPDENGEPLLRFSGKSLIKGEPDASSFPSGGLRATFEARGYTYWDCSSPAFIKDNILCIPTVFVSYHGESLDKKAPLLKSIEAIDTAATRIVNLLGEKDVKHVTPVVGLEQEYFLIDIELYKKRLDLRFTGRTLFGSNSAKTQELDDHYFGSIPSRVSDFMKEVNVELWKLGIYVKAEHNEAAPAQFELAPVFTNCNVAVDQNLLVMDILNKTARKYNFACLLHEKPFAGLNGSGKHNNWSLCTDSGQNLFSPGDKPAENIRFLVFMCAFIKAVDEYPELLRMAASNAGNDHRLGANEAPPAIISIYLGEYIEELLMNISSNNVKAKQKETDLNPILGLSYIPRDNTDRNRTSPMAFTGNKFEFRMLGSSISASTVNIVMNTMMAKTLDELSVKLEGIKYIQDVRDKSLELCKKIIIDHSRVIFSGDGYSNEWVMEAKKRGLPNIVSYIESIPSLIEAKSIQLFTDYKIYTEKELFARYEILNEDYNKTIEVEVRTLQQIVKREILPLLTKEMNELIPLFTSNHCPKYIVSRFNELESIMNDLEAKQEMLHASFDTVLSIQESHAQGIENYYKIAPLMKDIRNSIDAYEKISSKDIYNLPLYGDLLFGNR